MTSTIDYSNHEPAGDCISCEEEMPEHECPESKRPCGHHCNCSWCHDKYCWCGREFGEEEEEEI